MPFDMEMEEYEEELEYRKQNQGKSPQQVQFSNIMAGGSMIVMIVVIIISWLWKIIN